MKYEPKYVAGKGEVFCNRNSQQEPAQPALKWLILHLKYELETATLTVHPVGRKAGYVMYFCILRQADYLEISG